METNSKEIKMVLNKFPCSAGRPARMPAERLPAGQHAGRLDGRLYGCCPAEPPAGRLPAVRQTGGRPAVLPAVRVS